MPQPVEVLEDGGQDGCWTTIDHQQHWSNVLSVETRLRHIHVVDHFSGDGFVRSRAALGGEQQLSSELVGKEHS